MRDGSSKKERELRRSPQMVLLRVLGSCRSLESSCGPRPGKHTSVNHLALGLRGPGSGSPSKDSALRPSNPVFFNCGCT